MWCVVPCVVQVRGVVWSSGPLRCEEFSCPAPHPPCCCPLLPLPGPLSWPIVVFCPGVRCCVVLSCRLLCGLPLSALSLASGALLLRLRWLVLCGVACGCWVFVAWSGCPLLSSARVLCRWCSCLAAWLSALPCAVVCFGAPLPCAVSCVLWCCAAMWCHAVVPCRPFRFAVGVGLCPVPVCAVLFCAVRRVVRCRFCLCCCWCLVLSRVAVCCAVSLEGLWCGGAALLCGVVCRGVLLCRAVSCGAVLPCGAMLLGCAVCSHLLRVFLFPLKTTFQFLKIQIELHSTQREKAGRQQDHLGLTDLRATPPPRRLSLLRASWSSSFFLCWFLTRLES